MSVFEARRWARVGVLAALALVLSYVETFIPLPVPVPGIKLGLANIVVLVALALLDVKSAALVALLKVLAAGFLFGNPLMMLYSAGGTVLAFAAMAALSRIRGLSIVLVAVVGAMLHNVGQLAVASAILETPAVWATAPLLVMAACVTGALSGAATRYTLSCLEFDGFSAACEAPGDVATGKERMARGGKGADAPTAGNDATRSSRLRGHAPGGVGAFAAASRGDGLPLGLSAVDARVKFVCLLVFIVVALHARTAVSLALCVALAVACALAVRMGAREALFVLGPLAPILVVTVVMQVLVTQQGEVLAWLGPVAVTREAIAVSARMLASLFAVMLASVAFMRCTETEELVRMLRWLLSPLRAAGVRVDAFMLSLSVAFRFVPVLVGEFQQVKRAQEARCKSFGGTVRERLGAYARLFAPLVRSAFRRADTLAEAFCARCFSSGAPATSLHAGRFALPEVACIAVTAAFAVIVLVV